MYATPPPTPRQAARPVVVAFADLVRLLFARCPGTVAVLLDASDQR